jgi:ubiquinone/menaquinone biosynthesis C-methylase UbiE
MRLNTGKVLVPAVVLLLLLGACGVAETWSEQREKRRDQKLHPDRVMAAVGVQPGMVIGEVGAGEGYFAVKLARRVGPGGRVYANDINEGSLEELDERCQEEGLTNIVTVVGEEDDPLLPDGELDMVFMVYAFHDIEQQVTLLVNLKQDLRPGASVVILDQDPEKTDEYGHFLTTDQVVDLFGQAGYRLVQSETFLEEDLVLVFKVETEL